MDIVKLLADRIVRQHHGTAMAIAFDGVDASGKTTIADLVNAELSRRNVGSERISIDKFHNPRETRMKRGELSPEGFFLDSFDLDAIKDLVLEPLRGNGGFITKGIFDYKEEAAIEDQKIEVRDGLIVLFDGIFLHRDELADYWDLSIFLDVTFETVIKRALLRDREYFGSEREVIKRYTERYIPGERLYIDAFRPKERA